MLTKYGQWGSISGKVLPGGVCLPKQIILCILTVSLSCGVPQGTILGPVHFQMHYIHTFSLGRRLDQKV